MAKAQANGDKGIASWTREKKSISDKNVIMIIIYLQNKKKINK